MRIVGAALGIGTAASFVLACTVTGEEATAIPAEPLPVSTEVAVPAIVPDTDAADAMIESELDEPSLDSNLPLPT